MPSNGENKQTSGPRGLMRSTALQVVSAVVATTVIAALGIDSLPSILPWGDEPSSTSVVDSSESTLSPTTSGVATTTSTISSTSTTSPPAPPTTKKPTTTNVLKTASFSNEVLTAAEQNGQPTWSKIPLSMSALKDSTSHENSANSTVSTATTPTACKWEQETLFLMSSGLCVLKVTIPQAPKNARFKKLEKTYRITVRSPVLPSPGTYSPQERVSAVATARGNFLTYGREVPTELILGDVLNYWRMKLRISLKQPDAALGPVRCFRVYARYQYGSKQSYNDFTQDQMGCQELSGTTSTKDFCVNFQPAWYQISGTTMASMGFTDQSGAILQDNYAPVKFGRIGWGLEWGWETYNNNQVPANKTLTAAEKLMVESETHRPSVEVLEIAAGKCS